MSQPARQRADDFNAELVNDLYEQYRQVMELSSDAMFIYLDDEHKVCNKNLADMWGYTKEEWSKQAPYLRNFVAQQDQFTVAQHYVNSRSRFKSVRFQFLARRKDGSVFDVDKAMTPISYKGQFAILNLVRQL